MHNIKSAVYEFSSEYATGKEINQVVINLIIDFESRRYSILPKAQKEFGFINCKIENLFLHKTIILLIDEAINFAKSKLESEIVDELEIINA